MENYQRYNKILIPTDGLEHSINASKDALWIADISNADIVVLHVVDTHIFRLGFTGFFKEDIYNMLMEEGKRIIERFKDRLDEDMDKCSRDIKIKTILKEGEPYENILKTIDEENIDLIVIGASNRHAIDKILLGSVTEMVVTKSNVPVLVVH